MDRSTSTWLKRVALLGAVCVVALSAALAWVLRPIHLRYYTDGHAIRVPAESAPTRDILWKPPVPLPPAINTDGEDYEPRLSPDGLTLYFVRGKAGGAADIFTAIRTPDGWSAPAPLAAVNSDRDDLGPELSPDGRTLYFYSDRPGGLGGYDLWLTRRADDGSWRAPVNLGARVNSEFNDYGPALAPDERTLYFASNRPRLGDDPPPDPHRWTGTIREDHHARDYDLYSAAITDAGFADAVALAELNTPHNEGTPAVSPVGDFLYFSSDRPGGLGGYDLYRARRTSAGLLAPTNLGAPINSPADDLDPGLSLDGYGLHFSSNRLAAAGAPAADRRFDIYYSASREVFSDLQTHQRAFNWAWFWSTFGPNLLFALLALLLLLLLLALMREAHRRRLGLLVRCLLASVLAHLLLVVLFNFWQVTTALASFQRGSSVRIALASPVVGDEIFTQIRGSLTDVATPPIAPLATPRATESLSIDTAQVPTQLAHLSLAQTAPPALARLDLNSDPAPSAAPALPAAAPLSAPAVPAPSEPLALASPTDAPRSAAPEPVLDPLAQRTPPAPPARADNLPRADAPPLRTASLTPTASPAHAAAASPRPLAPEQLLDPPQVAPAAAAENAPTPLPAPTPHAAPADSAALDLALPATASARPTPADDPIAAPAPPALAAPRSPAPDPFRTDSSPTQLVALAPTTDLARALALPNAMTPPDAQLAPAPQAAHVASVAPPRAIPLAPAPALDLPPLESPPTAPTRAEPVDSPQPITPAAPASPRAELASAALAAPLDPTPLAPRLPETPRAVQLELPALTPTDLREVQPVDGPRPSPPDPHVTVPPTPLSLTPDLPLPAPDLTEPPPILDRPADAIGTLLGRVSAAATGEPLPGALVTLELAGRSPLTVVADADGWYQLAVPPVPEFFALSATHDGFIPASINVSAESLHDGVEVQDFVLEPLRSTLIVLEDEPELHHLGNDRFEGRVNSQFQRDAEGRTFAVEFELTAEQLAPGFTRAELSMLTKGVQCGHLLVINDHMLRRRLANSPSDGSFGEFTATFDAALLVEGINRFEIVGRSCSGDLDDFEFVNVQLQLIP